MMRDYHILLRRLPLSLRGIEGSTVLGGIARNRRFRRVLHTSAVRPLSLSATSYRLVTENKWSYAHGSGTIPMLGVTIGQLLEQRTAMTPDKEAAIVVHQNITITFQQLLEKSDQLAAGLVALGAEKGDRVGIWAPNCIEWIIVQYATARAGLILVNVNPAYQAKELEYCLNKVGIKMLIMAETFKTQSYYKMLSQICPELEKSPSGKINSRALPDLKLVVVTSEKSFAGAIRYSDLDSASNSQHLAFIKDQQDKLQFDDPCSIMFTSGTTGNPKGACMTHHNCVNNALYTGICQDLHINETRLCLPVPLYHAFGMVMGGLQSIINGTVCIYPAASFDPVATLKTVQDERCTALYGTPTMFVDMLNLPTFSKYNMKSLRTGIMAGAQCPVEIMKRVITEMSMEHITICYGSTEVGPVGFQTLPSDSIERRVGTVGKVHPNVEAKVIDDQGRIVPIGVPGEICFRGYGVMICYWDDPEKTSDAIGTDKWYKTGDIGVLDKDGYMQIVGRIKDMIIRGGENIYPVEIEQFLFTNPKIADVHVIGVPDDRLGEQVAAWIRLKPGQKATEQEIKDFCKGQIAHYKIPFYISFVTEFPLTITGKVQKFKMRETALEMYGLQQKKQK